ncbi:hypothetical protein M9H77_16180 [Catharanthus roseus]|uniref:Uncharacterized protein n=1 Tax=Catharanthus roseus TaxID=4058 RepID=A0ACC0AZ57_CATRO|nr:hypothetical protein M9H77_16180 [Catharanthus roseus]
MTSNFILKLILHLVANDPEIPVLNVIQEVQVLLQTGCMYKRAWYARKFATERVFGSWETTFSILPKYLQAMKDSNLGTVHFYMVKSPIRLNDTNNNVYTLKMNEKSCSFGKWQEHTLPCSHALAVCRDNGTRPDTYVLDTYSW